MLPVPAPAPRRALTWSGHVVYERRSAGPAAGRYPGPVDAGLSGTGLVADDLYLLAHDDRTGKPLLPPRPLGTWPPVLAGRAPRSTRRWTPWSTSTSRTTVGRARARPAPEVTVAGATAAAGLDLGGGHVTAALDGDPITTDGRRRWRPGDTVCLRPAGGRGSTLPGR